MLVSPDADPLLSVRVVPPPDVPVPVLAVVVSSGVGVAPEAVVPVFGVEPPLPAMVAPLEVLLLDVPPPLASDDPPTTMHRRRPHQRSST